MSKKDFKSPKIKVGKKLPKNLNVTKIDMRIAEIAHNTQTLGGEGRLRYKIAAKLDSKSGSLRREAIDDLCACAEDNPKLLQKFIDEHPTKIVELIHDECACQKGLTLVKTIFTRNFTTTPEFIDSVFFGILGMFSHFDVEIRICATTTFFELQHFYFTLRHAQNALPLVNKFIESILTSNYACAKESNFTNFANVFNFLSNYYTCLTNNNNRTNNSKTTFNFIAPVGNFEHAHNNLQKLMFVFVEFIRLNKKSAKIDSWVAPIFALAQLLFSVHKIKGDMESKENLDFNFYNINFSLVFNNFNQKMLNLSVIECRILSFFIETFENLIKYCNENKSSSNIDNIFTLYNLFIFYKRFPNDCTIPNIIFKNYISLLHALPNSVITKNFDKICFGLFWCSKLDVARCTQALSFKFLFNFVSTFVDKKDLAKNDSNYMGFIFEKVLMDSRYKKYYTSDEYKHQISTFIQSENFPKDIQINFNKYII